MNEKILNAENMEVTLEIPMDGHSGNTLRNILNMVYSKQPLIKKSLGLEGDLVETAFIENLKEIDVTSIDSFEAALDQFGEGGHPGIVFDFEKKTLTFKHSKGDAAIWLFSLINKKAKAQKRSQIKQGQTINEKYAFRTWLNSLGMVGKEYSEIRKELLKNLTGDASFRVPKGEVV